MKKLYVCKKTTFHFLTVVFAWIILLSIVFTASAENEYQFFQGFYQGQGNPYNGTLNIAGSITFSPDSKFLYMGSYGNDGISTFSCGNDSILLIDPRPRQFVDPTFLTVSPDGKFFYGVSSVDHSIVWYQRDEISGILQSNQSKILAWHGDSLLGLFNVACISITPDGKYAYTAGSLYHIITIFIRDISTGNLSKIGEVKYGIGGVDGLKNISYLLISPDGKNLYGIGQDSTIATFSISPQTGNLSYIGVAAHCNYGEQGKDPFQTIVMDNKGQLLIGVVPSINAITIFNRDTLSGNLVFVRNATPQDCAIKSYRFNSIAISPDRKYVYGYSYIDSILARFSLNQSTGELKFLSKTYINAISYIPGPRSKMAISPDGKLLVCSGSKENNVTFYSVDTSTGELYLKKEFLQGTVGYPGFTNFDFDLNTCQIIASAYRERYEEILTFLPNTNNDSFELRNELIADSSNSRSSLIDNTSIRMLDAHHFIYAGAAPSIPGTVYKRISVFTIDTIRNSLTSLSLFDSVKATFKNICVSNNREDIYFISNEFFHFRCDSTYQRYVRDSTLGRGNGGLCVTVSADDRFVFTGLDNSFSLYSRDSSTGNLSLIKTIKDGETGIQGLENISSLTISNDSKCLYIGTNSGIKYFSCDLQNNLLTYWGPVVLPCNNIALSYDNKTLIGATGNRIFVYSRDTVTGNLTKYDSLTCSHISPKKIAITNNGKYLFAFAFGLGNTGNGIEIFKNSPKVSINYKCFSSQKELRISYSSNGSFLSVKIKGLNSSLKLKLFDLSGRTVWQSNQLEPYLNDCNINIPKSYLRQPRVGEIITDKSRRLFFLTHFSD